MVQSGWQADVACQQSLGKQLFCCVFQKKKNLSETKNVMQFHS